MATNDGERSGVSVRMPTWATSAIVAGVVGTAGGVGVSTLHDELIYERVMQSSHEMEKRRDQLREQMRSDLKQEIATLRDSCFATIDLRIDRLESRMPPEAWRQRIEMLESMLAQLMAKLERIERGLKPNIL